MPDHKRQHYVPRCSLKPFSLDNAGAAINLFNIPRSRAVRAAPVKGQCARDYLYGADLKLERALQFFEGEYARVLGILQGNEQQPTGADLSFLRGFAYLQYSRTEMAMRRMQMAHEGMHNAIFEGRRITPPDLDLSDRTMMRSSMVGYAKTHEYVEDLKVCIIKNESRHDFIASDDPSILTSRFYVQRLGGNVFGVGSSGALFFLPLTPRLLLMCYDGSVYTTPEKRGCLLSITSEADTLALNELQYLKAAENIYFSRWDDRDRLEREFEQVRARRPQSWCQLSVFVPDGITEEGERYRRATEEDRKTALTTIVGVSTIHPAPSTWISKLKFRNPIKTFFDGSAAGHLRKATWLKLKQRRDPDRRPAAR